MLLRPRPPAVAWLGCRCLRAVKIAIGNGTACGSDPSLDSNVKGNHQHSLMLPCPTEALLLLLLLLLLLWSARLPPMDISEPIS